MPKNAFAKKISFSNDFYTKIGYMNGEQFAADIFAIAAEQCGISRPKIIEITKEASALRSEYAHAMKPNSDDEADKAQYDIDKALKRIYGDLFVKFGERYPYLKEVKY